MRADGGRDAHAKTGGIARRSAGPCALRGIPGGRHGPGGGQTARRLCSYVSPPTPHAGGSGHRAAYDRRNEAMTPSADGLDDALAENLSELVNVRPEQARARRDLSPD